MLRFVLRTIRPAISFYVYCGTCAEPKKSSMTDSMHNHYYPLETRKGTYRKIFGTAYLDVGWQPSCLPFFGLIFQLE